MMDLPRDERALHHPERQLRLTGKFMKAKLALDEAQDKLARAQTEFIDAERRYNEASRECVDYYFRER